MQLAIADASESWSFAKLNGQVLAMSKGLVDVGVEIGARVIFAARKSPSGVALALACFRNGVTFVPVDPDTPMERLRYMVECAEPALLVTDRTAIADCARAAGVVVVFGLEQLGAMNGTECRLAPAVFDPDRVAYMMFTSGSTGVPKAVAIPWRALASFYADIVEYYPVNRGARCLNTAPVYFDVSVLDTWFPLFMGASVRLTQPADLFPPRFLGILSAERIQFMCCVAPQLKLVADCGSLMDQFDLTSLHTVMTGAESPDPQAMQRWIAAVPTLGLLNGYGPTEATCVCTVYVIDRSNAGGPLPYPIGKPLAGTTYAVSDDGRNLGSTNEEGELWVAGPQLMQRYHGSEEQTHDKLVTIKGVTYYKTGDRVRKLPSGDLLYLGRIDEEVKVSGYRIDLSELTTVANGHPAVLESFAKAVVSPDTGFRYLVLAVRFDGHDKEIIVDDIRKSLAHQLPKYMQPRHIHAMREFPRLGSGKLDKRTMADILDGGVNAI
jgi:amino acid adenylation domain-containing protein